MVIYFSLRTENAADFWQLFKFVYLITLYQLRNLRDNERNANHAFWNLQKNAYSKICRPICYVDLVWSHNGNTVFNSNPVTHFVKPTIGRKICWTALFVLSYRFVELTVGVDAEILIVGPCGTVLSFVGNVWLLQPDLPSIDWGCYSAHFDLSKWRQHTSSEHRPARPIPHGVNTQEHDWHQQVC